MLKLFDNPASPFCRKVLVLLRETGQLDDVELTFAIGHPTDPGSMPIAENPVGKIPTLLREGGPAIYDSRVICRFLDDRAEATLYPEARLYDTLTLEATGDAIMDAAILMVYETRSRPEGERSPAWVEAQWSKITRTLAVLESRWMSHLHGPFDMGQVAVACALGYLDFRHPDRDWRAGHDNLAAWYKTISSRESLAATAPPEA